MNIFKNASLLTAGQRKTLAMLMLALACTNSQVSAAQAAELTPVDQLAMAQAMDAGGVAITPTEKEPVAPVTPPTVQEVLLSVCKSRGYDEGCAKTLLGMLWNESSNQSTVIGDHGLARGYFQIHYALHNITIACAEDLVCSANWTLTYMEAHSYPKYVNYAIQCHNSCGLNNGYAAKAVRNSKLMWDKPLTVTQEAPIEIAAQ